MHFRFYPGMNTGVTFASWMMYAVPPLILCLVIAWLWLQLAFMGPRATLACFNKKRKSHSESSCIKDVLQKEYDGLRGMSFAETSVLCWFFLLVALWVFRKPEFIEGWDVLFETGYVSSASCGMLIACILFAWPNQIPDFICFRKNKKEKAKCRKPILKWSAMQKKFPWSVIMLLGGGFALADGIKASHLSDWIGCNMQSALGNVPPAGVITIFIVIITFVTEISSNTAAASIFIPILLTAGENLKINPLYFALAGTIAPSFAFMLPIATPPNAIVYETGLVKITEMMTVGVVMNVLCIGVTLLNINTYGYWCFDLGSTPSWVAAHVSNSTAC